MTETTKLSHDALSASRKHGASLTPKSMNNIFMGLTLSMGWQLAAVMIVGLYGGHEIDLHFKTGPTWTVIGLIAAMISMVLIVRHTVQQLNQYMNTEIEEKK